MDLTAIQEQARALADSPLLIAGLLILISFILEDAATVTAGLLVADGTIGWPLAALALLLGLTIGDLGLYAAGWGARHWKRLHQWAEPWLRRGMGPWIGSRLYGTILGARLVPGLRLPIYSACGFLRVDLTRFALAVVVGVGLWTAALLTVTASLGSVLMEEIGPWRWAVGAGIVLALMVLPRLFHSSRKSGHVA